MNIAQNIDNFMQKIYECPIHRYTSWEICYKAFGNENLNDDIKALHLTGYLASWGMYRGSSKLLSEYNYMVFVDLIATLNGYMDLRKDFLEENDYDKFLELVKSIQIFLNNKNISPTDTLITKIILGVYGCFPALDNYFIKGFKLSFNGVKISIIQKNIFKKMYKNLKIFYEKNEEIFNNKRQEINVNRGINYTPMKLIDMCFWEYRNNTEAENF